MRRTIPASAALIAYGLTAVAPAHAAEERFSIVCAVIMFNDTREIMTRCGVPVPADGEARFQRIRGQFQQALRSTLPPAEADAILAAQERRNVAAAARNAGQCERALGDATRLFASVNTPEFEQRFGDVLRLYGPQHNPRGSCL